jgi:hypothetical protein
MASVDKKRINEIEKKFNETAFGLTQERNDFLLPQITDFVVQKKWINLRPEYQRRLVWDQKKRSAFIESLLLNIPIPTLFLFERELGRYEVMDGQQRINAVLDFYSGRYALKGLEKWVELNGLKHADLPEVLKRGLDRRRLSATVVVVDSSKPRPAGRDNDVRKMVFQRLNTGGQHLNAQELRNCLYAGLFNDLIINLSSTKQFRKIWGITPPKKSVTPETEAVDSDFPERTGLEENQTYSRMLDCEIVLRFFAFRDSANLRGSVRDILDECMERNVPLDTAQVGRLRAVFISRLKLAESIFRSETFRYSDSNGKSRLSRPLYDAVMIALDVLWEHRSKLLARRAEVVNNISKLLKKQKAFAVIVGKPNTAKAIHQRIDLIRRAMVRAMR